VESIKLLSWKWLKGRRKWFVYCLSSWLFNPLFLSWRCGISGVSSCWWGRRGWCDIVAFVGSKCWMLKCKGISFIVFTMRACFISLASCVLWLIVWWGCCCFFVCGCYFCFIILFVFSILVDPIEVHLVLL